MHDDGTAVLERKCKIDLEGDDACDEKTVGDASESKSGDSEMDQPG